MCPPRSGRRAASRHRRAIDDCAADTVLAVRSARRAPRRPTLPPLFVVKHMKLVKSMVNIETKARSSFVVVEAGIEAGGWKLEAGYLRALQDIVIARNPSTSLRVNSVTKQSPEIHSRESIHDAMLKGLFRDCFAEPVLSSNEGLAMTSKQHRASCIFPEARLSLVPPSGALIITIHHTRQTNSDCRSGCTSQ